MTETTLRSITNSRIWIPMLAPTYSTMISSDEQRYRGFKQSHIQFPLSICMLPARDSIVDIIIPSSISLPASLFTRSVMHHPVTNSLVILLARLIMMSITERAQRYLSETGVTNPNLDLCQPNKHLRRHLYSTFIITLLRCGVW